MTIEVDRTLESLGHHFEALESARQNQNGSPSRRGSWLERGRVYLHLGITILLAVLLAVHLAYDYSPDSFKRLLKRNPLPTNMWQGDGACLVVPENPHESVWLFYGGEGFLIQHPHYSSGHWDAALICHNTKVRAGHVTIDGTNGALHVQLIRAAGNSSPLLHLDPVSAAAMPMHGANLSHGVAPSQGVAR